MLNSGDVVSIDLGVPSGREARLQRPAVVITAQRILDAQPSVVQVVPLTSTIRDFDSEVTIPPDAANGLAVTSAAQAQHIRSLSVNRVSSEIGNVGSVVLHQIRESVGVIINI